MATFTPAATAGPAAPGAPLEWSPKAARDRLSSTLFLAALFHGVVILGVTFSGGNDEAPSATSLDVVIVTSEQQRTRSAQDAVLLAEQSIDGAGNTTAPDQLHTALARAGDAAALGPQTAGAAAPVREGSTAGSEPVLVTTSAAEARALPPEPEGQRQAVQQAMAMPGERTAVEIIDEPAEHTRITDSGSRELVISASTRESRLAAYLSNWKRQVERFGTLNFPRQAQARQRRGNPVLEVAIRADGGLADVVVRDSSGERLLDDAAVEILRNAAPFDPFPDALRSDYDVLRFAYEWRFGADGLTGGS